MSELKYVKDKPWTFHHRLAMCRAMQEGTELADIIDHLCAASKILHAFNDYESEMALLMAENLCREYVKGRLWMRQCDWEEYNEIDAEVYAHFTGGARKLTKAEFEA